LPRKTRLSDVRGEAGELIYAGYDINELAGKVTFEEVIHLLHWNHLPNRKELAELHATLAAERELPKGVVDILRLVPKGHSAHGHHPHRRFRDGLF
jgi:citrate synthase